MRSFDIFRAIMIALTILLFSTTAAAQKTASPALDEFAFELDLLIEHAAFLAEFSNDKEVVEVAFRMLEKLKHSKQELGEVNDQQLEWAAGNLVFTDQPCNPCDLEHVCPDDGDPCTEDICHPQIRQCVHKTRDICPEVFCADCDPKSEDQAQCDDGDTCTDDYCDPVAGFCQHQMQSDCRVCQSPSGSYLAQGDEWCPDVPVCKDGKQQVQLMSCQPVNLTHSRCMLDETITLDEPGVCAGEN